MSTSLLNRPVYATSASIALLADGRIVFTSLSNFTAEDIVKTYEMKLEIDLPPAILSERERVIESHKVMKNSLV